MNKKHTEKEGELSMKKLFDIDYSNYLSQHDIVYHSPADKPYEGLPIGNGNTGAMVWTPACGFEAILNKCDIYDDGPPGDFDCWAAEEEEKWTVSRGAGTLRIDASLPLHDIFYLNNFETRLNLYRAKIILSSKTPFSEVRCESFLSEDYKVGIIRYNDRLAEPVQRKIKLSRWGSRTFSHWYKQIKRDPSVGLESIEAESEGEYCWIKQTLRSMNFITVMKVVGIEGKMKREHSRLITFESNPSTNADFIIYYTIITNEEAENPLDKAKERLEKASAIGWEAIEEAHCERWSDFWSKSFIHLSEDYLENLWYIHLYLMGSSSSGRYPANFIDGLWSPNRDFRAWTHFYHWNQQSMYWFLGPAGHSELERSYLEWRHMGLPQAREYARKQGVIQGAAYNDVSNRNGWNDSRTSSDLNRTPGLQIAMDFWRHYQYTGDKKFLRELAWMVMKETSLYFLNILEQGDDGKLHMPSGTAYEGGLISRDTITELAAIRAAFQALIDTADILGFPQKAEPFAKALRDLTDFTLVDLPEVYYVERGDGSYYNREWPQAKDYPVSDKYGAKGFTGDERIYFKKVFSVGFLEKEKARPFTWKDTAKPHKGIFVFRGTQESPVFPAGIIGLKDRGTDLFNAAVTTAKGNWTPSHGHCITPIVFARLGLREELKKCLADFPSIYQYFPQGFFNYAVKGGTLDPLFHNDNVYNYRNSDHLENGYTYQIRRDPFVHFAFDASGVFCCTLMEMLLQSYDGVIRVFPSIPKDWSGSIRLKAVGCFWVEATKNPHGISPVRVESERGGAFRIENPWKSDEGEIIVMDDTGMSIEYEYEKDEISFNTSSGCSYIIAHGSQIDNLPENPLLFSGEPNAGVKKHGEAQLGKERDF